MSRVNGVTPPRFDPRGPGERTIVAGLGFAIGAYVIWGLVPIYFKWLEPAGPYEIVTARIILSIAFCATGLG